VSDDRDEDREVAEELEKGDKLLELDITEEMLVATFFWTILRNIQVELELRAREGKVDESEDIEEIEGVDVGIDVLWLDVEESDAVAAWLPEDEVTWFPGVTAGLAVAEVIVVNGVASVSAGEEASVVSGTVRIEKVEPLESTSICCTTDTVWMTSVTSTVVAAACLWWNLLCWWGRCSRWAKSCLARRSDGPAESSSRIAAPLLLSYSAAICIDSASWRVCEEGRQLIAVVVTSWRLGK
jgi:hypothetical protein